MILAAAACLLIRNVTVIDPGASSVRLADIRLEGNRIANVGQASASPNRSTPKVHDAAEMRREIRWQPAADVDCIKIYAYVRPEMGAIRPGARADLVLLERDPLQALRNTRSIALVIHDGVAYDPRELLHP